MNRLESRLSRYAIKNLTLILIICYGVGYLLQLVAPDLIEYFMLNPYEVIHSFQIWRIFTWILLPPDSFGFFTLLMLYFYFSLGTSLEMVWGTYRYNIYLIGGFLFTLVGSFIIYGISTLILGSFQAVIIGRAIGLVVSTYYVNMSIFLAYAATFPNTQIYIFFFIPVKVKVLGIIYAAILVYQVVSYAVSGRIIVCMIILVSLLNFLIFFLTQRKKLKLSPGTFKGGARFKRPSGGRAASTQAKTSNAASNGRQASAVTRHKCAICGQTELSNPELGFRFCSKCNGNYEYCEQHLFTHKHVE